MHVALACAGRRGYRFLCRLIELAPTAQFTVFSFREEPHEPPFLDDIRSVAEKQGSFIETRKLDGPRGLRFWDQADVDLLLVVGWRYLISRAVYERPRRGSFVLHDSLLPRYRGFSPTVWAICNGEDHTGATLFTIADDVDSGTIIDQKRVEIGPEETIATVVENVTQAYLSLLEHNLPNLLEGTAAGQPQEESQRTYVPKRTEADNQIDWTWPTGRIHNLIRAVSAPYPGAFCQLRGRRLRVWSASRAVEQGVPGSNPPGAIIERIPEKGALVQTGSGAILLGLVQWEGDLPRCAAEALADVIWPLGS